MAVAFGLVAVPRHQAAAVAAVAVAVAAAAVATVVADQASRYWLVRQVLSSQY